MEKGKHLKKKFKIIESYAILIFIATLFMCIGYAKTSNTLTISGTLEPSAQEGVFITNITKANESENESEIKFFIGTMFESKIVLDSNESALQTYNVEIFNNSNKKYIFIDTLTDITDGTLYDNDNIEFYLSNIESYTTIIEPNQNFNFQISFKYKIDADFSKNILNSKLNFRFKEMPQFVLSNDGETYTLNNIYPDYEPQRYEFTIKNYIEDDVNNVPLSYYFNVTIDKPLNAKIYDENNVEITENINLSGDSQTKEDNTYFLEILWDDSNEEENIAYDSSYYENKQFSCDVEVIAKPNDEKYCDFKIAKAFDIDIASGDYKNSFNISYINIPNDNYPSEIAFGESLEITFTKEVPPDVQVTGVGTYTYNKPTLIINNPTDDVEIVNNTGTLIAYEYPGDYIFTGNTYIDTGVKLFSQANISRDFRISFEITEDDQNQATYNTLLSIMDESGSPYPGFLFRIGSNDRVNKYELTANSIAGKGKAYYNDRVTTKKVEIIRVDSILYAKINDGEYEQMQDYTTFSNYFDVPVTIGASLRANGQPFRYFKGILSNIEITFLNTNVSQNLINSE